MKKHITYLKRLGACQDAVEWAKQFNSAQEVWDACKRGDWMLWLLGKQSGKPGTKSRKKLVLTACKCARLSLKYITKGEERPLKAIQTAEKYAKGIEGITLQDVRNAAYAAAAADAAADAAYAAYAAAAAYAAYAAAAAYAARGKTLKKCANIVRKDYPKIRMTP